MTTKLSLQDRNALAWRLYRNSPLWDGLDRGSFTKQLQRNRRRKRRY